MLESYLDNVRENAPLVHNITNYVTANDVANAVLAVGASPIMSDEPEEAADITRICDGLNINIGTLHQQSIRSMYLAGKRAMELGHALLLDPVGAGASKLRTETAAGLIEELHFTVIRGNISEIKALCLGSTTTKGVDADAADAVTEANLADMIVFAKTCAKSCGSVIAITGAIDLVADADACYVIRNGRKEMSTITGTGCQLSGVMTAFLAANPGHALAAAAAAAAAMGLAGEIAMGYMTEGDGNATYRNRIIDALYHMTAERLNRGERIEIR